MNHIDRSTEDLLTRCRVQRVGGAEHGTASLDSVQALPNHADNGARGHVSHETGEEGLANVLSIVYRRVSRSRRSKADMWYIRFSRCSGVAWTSFMATNLNPRCSNLEMMLPTSPRWTPSGCNTTTRHDQIWH